MAWHEHHHDLFMHLYLPTLSPVDMQRESSLHRQRGSQTDAERGSEREVETPEYTQDSLEKLQAPYADLRTAIKLSQVKADVRTRGMHPLRCAE